MLKDLMQVDREAAGFPSAAVPWRPAPRWARILAGRRIIRCGYPGRLMPSTEAVPARIAQYRIIRQLGSGGMAKVFLAEDERLQRQVALKLLPRHETDTIATEARFLQEARAAARLDHPNVCAIHEVGEAPEGNYIVMPFVEGETLAARMARRSLDLKESLDIVLQVLDALAEAHTHGIIHRDIKPANIMLTPKDQVKVLDFGLAKTTAPGGNPALLGLTQSGMVVGTVPYMSPEQLKAEPLDGRSDLFSVGTLLYEMVCGKRPFQAKSGAEVMSAILKEIPPLLEDGKDLPGMPPALRRILRHAMDKDPDRRFPTAAAFGDELTVFSQSLAVGGSDDRTAIQRSTVQPGWMASLWSSGTPLQRHRGLRWSLIALLAALGMGAMAWITLPMLVQHRQRVDSVAVLPIRNATGDPELDWMCEGLGEQLTNQLSRLPKLKVIARSSVLRYQSGDPDLPAVGRDLGVKALLVGRLLQHQGQVSLSFELVQAADRRHLWGQRIERPADHLVDTQNALAEELSVALSGRMDPESRQALAGGRIRTSSEAYQLYLKGRHYADKWNPEDLGRAMAYFDQALAKDPAFALAHVGIANAYWGMSGTFKPSGEVMPRVKVEARNALALDPELAEAHTALGIATWILDRDQAAAESSLRRGIALNPNSSTARVQYGYFLMAHNRKQESILELDRGVELDPQSPNALIFRGIASTFLRDHSKALADARRVIALEPGFWFGYMVAAGNEYYLHRPETALNDIEKAVSLGSPFALAYKGFLLGKLNRPQEAVKILGSLRDLSDTGKTYVSPYYFALVQTGLGRNAEAIASLKKVEETREEQFVTLGVDIFFESLWSDPEFKRLRAKAYPG